MKSFPCLPPDIRHWEDRRLLLKLNKVIAKACAFKLGERYNSAERLLDDLEDIHK